MDAELKRRRLVDRHPIAAPRVVLVGPYDPGRSVDVAILMTGGTLPSEQRRGHYGALIDRCLHLGRERGCAALLGFVTHGNTSGRGLTRRGAFSIPGFYLVSDARRPRLKHVDRRPMRALPLNVILHRRHLRDQADQIRFAYAATHDWQGQFLQRPYPIKAVRIAHDALAAVETVGDTDRLQWLACPPRKTLAAVASLAAASATAGRHFFLYTLDPRLSQATLRLGFRLRDGYLKILPTGIDDESLPRLAAAPWNLQSGDRM